MNKITTEREGIIDRIMSKNIADDDSETDENNYLEFLETLTLEELRELDMFDVPE